MSDIDLCERAVQIFLLTLFSLLITIIAVTFGFAIALITVSFKILKSFIALYIVIADEISIRKEVHYATQSRSKGGVQAQG